jgi:proteasome lid subunit RPN8/RPN11
VRIRQGVLAAIVAHAREDLPHECCGLLVGTPGFIESAVPTRNARRSPTRFLIEPADQVRVMREARASGRQIIGAYHSHPAGPPYPSETDLAELYDTTLVHVIVSLASGAPTIDAFVCEEGAFRSIALEPI